MTWATSEKLPQKPLVSELAGCLAESMSEYAQPAAESVA
jgi:hypothetical protein